MFAKLANNRKLEEATSAKDDVAPMYLLDEIAQLANGGGETAQGLADATIKRLGNRSPVALRLIKHVSNKGASEYRRAICKQAKEIRELTHYKGDPDPFKGDVLNQKVRDAAKETLDAIFQATDTNYSSNSTKPTLTNRIQGFGSTNSSEPAQSSTSSRGNLGNYSGGFSSSSNNNNSSNGGGGGMVGFGNPRFDSSSSNNSSGNSSGVNKWLPASVANKLDSLSMLPKDRAGGLRFEGNHGYSSGEDSPQRHSSSHTYTHPNLPQDPQRAPLTSTPTYGQSYSQASPSGRSGDEAHLVDDMCTPGGLRAQPDREDLRLFVENAASLNGTTVAELLQAKMERGSWQEVLRALCAVEAVVSQGSSAACGEIAVHFQANADVVRGAMKSPQASVRQCAMRVFKLLGGDTLPQPSHAPASASAVAAPDLMGNLLGEEETPAAAPQDFLGDLLGDNTAASPATAADTGGMFAGLDVGSSNTQAAAPQVSSLLSGLDVAPATPQSPMDALAGLQGPPHAPPDAGAQQADMFGGLSLEGPAAGPSQIGLDALMGLGSPQALVQSPAAGASTDLFGGLSVGDSHKQASAHLSNGPSAAASAADLEGLFTSVSTPSQPQPQGPGPQLWPSQSHQQQQGRAGMGSPQAGMGSQPGFSQPGIDMQPGAQMGYMPGFLGAMMPPGMMPQGMMPPGISPSMMFAMQAQLGPGGMPSGQIPMHPSNPMQGMPGIPSGQMEYLQRQMQAMAMQRPPGMGQQPFPGQQMPGTQMQSAGSSGLSDFLGGAGPQGSSPSAPGAKTDLLGRALSSNKQDSFDFIGEHMGKLKK
ncbi:MAG: VHS domain-containing protein [Trebouxia sp. A1-2]|nr:MAG: VHS domain-containing protein [Trebouxia sp. A1-2]